MIEAPEVRYARSGELSLAYQVVGAGPVDVVELPGVFSHLEAKWDEPGLVRFMEGIARFARLIVFDRRGMGLSDRLTSDVGPTLDQQIADVRAVMDAAGSRTAILFGVGDGGPTAAAFAARHPDRTRGLVLYNAALPVRRRPEFPYGAEDVEPILREIAREWGTGVMAARMGAEDFRHEFARVERRACTPQGAVALLRAHLVIDLWDVLPAIAAPTRVLHYREHPSFPSAGARAAAARIPGARYVETPGYSAVGVLRERRGLVPAIEELATGTAGVEDADRLLAAILFTDIVGSTAHAAELGDRRWRDLLDEHDRRVRRVVEAGGGTVVKTTGDGVLARFDGARRAVRAGAALVAEGRRLGVAVRAGVDVGRWDRRRDDLAGLTVHIAARVAALAGAGEVLATATVRDALVGTDVCFTPRATETLRGVPGTWPVFAVEG